VDSVEVVGESLANVVRFFKWLELRGLSISRFYSIRNRPGELPSRIPFGKAIFAELQYLDHIYTVKQLGRAYDPYEKYGLKRVINAATSLTILGASMP
jgi:hypothetical protein